MPAALYRFLSTFTKKDGANTPYLRVRARSRAGCPQSAARGFSFAFRLFSLAFYLQAAALAEAAPAATLYPASPHQGETLFVLCDQGPGSVGMRCDWDGTAIPVAQAGGSMLATIGIGVTERPGRHVLRLRYPDGIRGARVESRAVTVQRTAWPVQYLHMKRSTERLYTFPGARQEDAMVRAATHTFSPEILWSGPFLLPTKGRLATRFGVKRIRNGHTTYYHRGLDLAAPTGTPVLAPNAGRVVLARTFKKYGHTIVLDHGLGVTTLYLHMSALAVNQGDRVERGQLIGKVGMEGVATGPHLHWSLYVHGDSVSPAFWTHLPAIVTTRVGDDKLTR